MPFINKFFVSISSVFVCTFVRLYYNRGKDERRYTIALKAKFFEKKKYCLRLKNLCLAVLVFDELSGKKGS